MVQNEKSGTPAGGAALATTAAFAGERREVLQAAGGIPLTVHHPLTASGGVVLLVPGWSGTRAGPAEILVFIASALARAGWLAVRFDLPGRGDAGGAFGACDLDQMIDCAARLLLGAQASSLPPVAGRMPALPAYLLGLCSGGNVALGTASKQEFRDQALGVIALSTLPFQPARSKQFERRRRWKNVKQYLARALAPSTWLRLLKGEINLRRVKQNVTASEKPGAGERNLKDSRRDIERELLSWKGRALFVWGGGDEEAPLARAHFERLHAAGLGRPGHAAFQSVAGANHNFYAQPWRQETVRLILNFLNTQL